MKGVASQSKLAAFSRCYYRTNRDVRAGQGHDRDDRDHKQNSRIYDP